MIGNFQLIICQSNFCKWRRFYISLASIWTGLKSWRIINIIFMVFFQYYVNSPFYLKSHPVLFSRYHMHVSNDFKFPFQYILFMLNLRSLYFSWILYFFSMADEIQFVTHFTIHITLYSSLLPPFLHAYIFFVCKIKPKNGLKCVSYFFLFMKKLHSFKSFFFYKK